MIPIDAALTDGNLLGSALGPPKTWSAWRTVLKAAFAQPLTADEAATFTAVAGTRAPPGGGFASFGLSLAGGLENQGLRR